MRRYNILVADRLKKNRELVNRLPRVETIHRDSDSPDRPYSKVGRVIKKVSRDKSSILENENIKHFYRKPLSISGKVSIQELNKEEYS